MNKLKTTSDLFYLAAAFVLPTTVLACNMVLVASLAKFGGQATAVHVLPAYDSHLHILTAARLQQINNNLDVKH